MKRTLSLVSAILLAFNCFADEGMWMVHNIDSQLMGRMRAAGLTLEAQQLYGSEGAICNSVVSLDFSCSGSIISHDGLMITNHHCAYSFVHALSTPEHNYLEDGFWATSREQEIPLKGANIWFLKQTIDVSADYDAIRDSIIAAGGIAGSRRVTYLVEQKYKKMFDGYEISCDSMYKGIKHYLAVYEVYHDIRLVAAPPVSVAAFGGDPDNWEWPQHKGDFAMYRIYADAEGRPAEFNIHNIPLHTEECLKVSTKGVAEGDYSMVLGYPGTTDRYQSPCKVCDSRDHILPITTSMRRKEMEIIWRWMDTDPVIRLKYADYYFGLSNVQELNEGEIQCFKRFDVEGLKWQNEVSKFDSDTLMPVISRKYAAVHDLKTKSTYYREGVLRSTRLSGSVFAVNSALSDAKKQKKGTVRVADIERNMSRIEAMESELDLRVEKELLAFGLQELVDHIPASELSPVFEEICSRFNNDMSAYVDYLWKESVFTSCEALIAAAKEEKPVSFYENDPLFRTFMPMLTSDINKEIADAEGSVSVLDLENEYGRTLYKKRCQLGETQYPDANSTMRLTYGNVCRMLPRDGITYDFWSSAKGILEKYNPSDYNYVLKPEYKSLIEKAGRFPVNFLTNNDITGGNSGSPVLNGRGELTGLAFDGNKESLAGNAMYIPGYTNTVCVDIRYVLWILEKYAGMSDVLKEIVYAE